MKTPYTLPYAYDALEPYIDTRTVALHYQNHYLNYWNRLQDLLKQDPELKTVSYRSLAQHLDLVPLQFRDQVAVALGGVLNHELYFSVLTPNGSKEPIGTLKEAILEQYGSFANFKEAFEKEAQTLVGSGYTFLVVNAQRKLQIITLSNQDTPYYYQMTPILALDLWEHAYYLNYQSNRNQYIKNFFQIVNFDVVEKNYEQAFSQT